MVDTHGVKPSSITVCCRCAELGAELERLQGEREAEHKRHAAEMTAVRGAHEVESRYVSGGSWAT
eukprot:1157226-Pelagomonas_calceolata.AAC.8